MFISTGAPLLLNGRADGQMMDREGLQRKDRLALNLVAGFLLSLRIIPGNKNRFEIHPNLIKTLDTKDCAFLTA